MFIQRETSRPLKRDQQDDEGDEPLPSPSYRNRRETSTRSTMASLFTFVSVIVAYSMVMWRRHEYGVGIIPRRPLSTQSRAENEQSKQEFESASGARRPLKVPKYFRGSINPKKVAGMHADPFDESDSSKASKVELVADRAFMNTDDVMKGNRQPLRISAHAPRPQESPPRDDTSDALRKEANFKYGTAPGQAFDFFPEDRRNSYSSSSQTLQKDVLSTQQEQGSQLHKGIDRSGVIESLTTIRQDWQGVINKFLDTVEPEMFATKLIQQNFEEDVNNLHATSMLVTTKNGNVSFSEKYGPSRHGRASSAKYILDKIQREKGNSLPSCTFLVMMSDGHRPRVPTLGSARHWKFWKMMIPVPLGNSRGSRISWGTPFRGWDQYIHETIVRTHANYRWADKDEKAVFRGSLVMQRHKLGSCNEENHGRCVRAGKWNEINRGRLLEKSLDAPELFNVSFTQHKFRPDGPKSQFDGVPSRLGRSINFPDFQKFKYVINVGSNQDWAERLRSLLFMNSAVIMHEAETQEFFSPLLKPWIHFIPTDLHMDNLVKNVKWARENDKHVQQIVRNQNAFAHRYITERAMQQYWEEILEEFAARQARADAM